MGFNAVAEKVESQKWKQTRHGQGDGAKTLLYFQRPVLEELKRRCAERGISVSRFLQTLAVESLEADER